MAIGPRMGSLQIEDGLGCERCGLVADKRMTPDPTALRRSRLLMCAALALARLSSTH